MPLLDIVLPIFLVIGLGYALRAIGLVTRAVDDALARLVFNVSAPALLLRSAALAPLREAANPRVLTVLIVITVGLALLGYAACRRLPPARRGVLAQGAHRSNMVFVGLPVVANAYGAAGLAASTVVVGVLVMLYNLLGVLLLTLPHTTRSARSRDVWVAAIRLSARNPLILSCAGGMLWSATGAPLPAVADRTLELVGRIALPVALLSVGAGLELRRVRAELKATLAACLVKLVVYPAAVWLALRATGLTGMALAVPVLLMASPTAVVSYIMAREMQGDERLAGAFVIGTTLCSLPTYLGWLILLRAAQPLTG